MVRVWVEVVPIAVIPRAALTVPTTPAPVSVPLRRQVPSPILRTIVPVVALEMNLDLSKEYRGPAQLVLVRKKGDVQKVEAFDPDKLYAQGASPPPKPDAKAKPEPEQATAD